MKPGHVLRGYRLRLKNGRYLCVLSHDVSAKKVHVVSCDEGPEPVPREVALFVQRVLRPIWNYRLVRVTGPAVKS